MRFIRLVDAGRSLTRAALEASFGSYAQCHRVFHQYLGCTPRVYFAAGRAEIDSRLEPQHRLADGYGERPSAEAFNLASMSRGS